MILRRDLLVSGQHEASSFSEARFTYGNFFFFFFEINCIEAQKNSKFTLGDDRRFGFIGF